MSISGFFKKKLKNHTYRNILNSVNRVNTLCIIILHILYFEDFTIQITIDMFMMFKTDKNHLY